jgi:UDP-2,4-diacetamido-2,4,6-trideoxy-beta-L-altropyranose hydrolase
MNLLFRADANVSIGTGHVMRCLALAQACQDDGGSAIFAAAEITPALSSRFAAEKIVARSIDAATGSSDDARQTAILAQEAHAAWVVIDGYQFDVNYQTQIAQAGLKLLTIDDTGGAGRYTANVVLNQNLHACPTLYRNRESHTRLLLGPRFSLLRREFRPWNGWKRSVSAGVQRILVTMGGSDPDNVTSLIITSLAQSNLGAAKVTVLVGGSNPRREALLRQITAKRLEVELIADADDVPGLLASSDIAISGAGTTCWEMCLLGLPALLIELAPNQHEVGQRLHDLGAATFLGRSQDISPNLIARELEALLQSAKRRRTMSENAQRIVDGNGSARLLSFLKHDVRLRRTSEEDCRMFWEWANDPEVRAMSFSSQPVSWETHVGWFTSKQVDPASVLYVATDENSRPIGQVQYQFERDRAVLSISLSPEFRGKGLGKTVLLAATEELFQTSPANVIDAFVKLENQPSLRLFDGAGFRREGLATVHGQTAVHFALTKNGVA